MAPVVNFAAVLKEVARLRHRIAILSALAREASQLFLEQDGPPRYLIGDEGGRAEPADLDVVVGIMTELEALADDTRAKLRELTQARVSLPKGVELPMADGEPRDGPATAYLNPEVATNPKIRASAS